MKSARSIVRSTKARFIRDNNIYCEPTEDELKIIRRAASELAHYFFDLANNTKEVLSRRHQGPAAERLLKTLDGPEENETSPNAVKT